MRLCGRCSLFRNLGDFMALDGPHETSSSIVKDLAGSCTRGRRSVGVAFRSSAWIFMEVPCKRDEYLCPAPALLWELLLCRVFCMASNAGPRCSLNAIVSKLRFPLRFEGTHGHSCVLRWNSFFGILGMCCALWSSACVLGSGYDCSSMVSSDKYTLPVSVRG